jgi:hypothetical protein
LCCLFLTAVGGARPRGGWRSLVITRLQGFSSWSPAVVPRRRSPRMMTVGLIVGKSEPGYGLPLPSASRMFIIRAGEEGAPSWVPPPRGQRPAASLSVRGGKGVRRPWPERLWCCFQCRLLPLGRSMAARPPHGCRSRRARASHVQVLPVPPAAPGSHNTSYAARAVFVFWDDLVLAPVARTGVRTCRCAPGRPPFIGAVLVGRWPLSSVLRWWSP